MSDRNGTERLLHHWREVLPVDRLAHLIRDVARMQMRALQQRLAMHDVSFGHWTFLRILWVNDGLTQRELSESAGVMEPTTFSAVKAMEATGLIERRQLAGNRKNVHVFLTDKGRALEPLLVPMAIILLPLIGGLAASQAQGLQTGVEILDGYRTSMFAAAAICVFGAGLAAVGFNRSDGRVVAAEAAGG